MKYLKYLLTSLIVIVILSLAACSGDSGRQRTTPDEGEAVAEAPAESAGDPAAGQEKFLVCSACHGPEGKGVPGLGKDMTTSEFIAGKTDEELVAFLKIGRDPSDPLNTTGVAMPPKGGNPALNEQDLYNIVAYVRTLVQ